ncbi:MAG: TonB-dependent receptor plug domain-containing protein [Desulfuromonadaceae bacterium]
MKFHYNAHSLRALFLVLCLTVCLIPSMSWGESGDIEDSTDLFNAWQEQDVTTSRVPKPLSQTAENVTVITAADIRALNAHTLADILDTIPGIQLQHNGGPGITAYTFIQSTDFIHSQVFIDGVSLSNLTSNFADVSLIPAQIVERVEIVKGAASSSWGQALGGVINVITKSPNTSRSLSGSATASIGERTTADTRAELSGTNGNLGYYLSGGYLGSNGLLPTMQIGSNHIYTKLTYDLPNQGQLWGTVSYNYSNAGNLYALSYDLKERDEKKLLLASLGLRYTIAPGLDFELTGRHSDIRQDSFYRYISNELPWEPALPTGKANEEVNGASAKLTWRKAENLLVTGIDYNHQYVYNNTSDGSTVSPWNKTADRYGIFLNDTVSLGSVSLSPGVRLDHTQTSGDQVSSSFGATWQATDSTLLRAYIGRGFGLPALQLAEIKPLKILTMQIGAESTAVRYLWLKGTLFRNRTWGDDIEQLLALGTEFEVRTTPVFNTSLSAGWTYTNTTRTSDGSTVYNMPRHTLQLALRYDDKTFRGMLAGRHIHWNSEPDYNARYGGLLWDLHLGATLLKREDSSFELFFSGHNLFDSAHYNRDVFPNAGRWFEGGVRVNF